MDSKEAARLRWRETSNNRWAEERSREHDPEKLRIVEKMSRARRKATPSAKGMFKDSLVEVRELYNRWVRVFRVYHPGITDTELRDTDSSKFQALFWDKSTIDFGFNLLELKETDSVVLLPRD
ncbi:hypothetical protein PENSUB_9273 [Penicillium subrubescens]|uniref:Uncharacterized protein n=1 Tax=Penicillium subrubescens TaxID=1316194 RepID=A0A1Q5TD80_9EURO|nr:hypothetical protein PENSUB_9273 [Penicillium subrubescens]